MTLALTRGGKKQRKRGLGARSFAGPLYDDENHVARQRSSAKKTGSSLFVF
ncbi:hypothetical protein PHOSAC3_140185 [Mesotoga infera]|nr:hypothetical protein PHOSAC3_140185 [Mesotoga infera]